MCTSKLVAHLLEAQQGSGLQPNGAHLWGIQCGPWQWREAALKHPCYRGASGPLRCCHSLGKLLQASLGALVPFLHTICCSTNGGLLCRTRRREQRASGGGRSCTDAVKGEV